MKVQSNVMKTLLGIELFCGVVLLGCVLVGASLWLLIMVGLLFFLVPMQYNTQMNIEETDRIIKGLNAKNQRR